MSISISYGKKSVFKRNVFQAACTRSENKQSCEKTIESFKSQDPKCIWVVICYRIDQFEDFYEEEEGAGCKVLGLLKRMGVRNLVMGVKLWPDGAMAQHDIYRMTIGAAKDLLIDFYAPKQNTQALPKPKKPHIIEIETLPPENQKFFSDSSSFIKSSPSNVLSKTLKTRIPYILSKITEPQVKALQDFINHSVIGKVLLILLVLLQKQKPTYSLAKEFYLQNNIKELLTDLDPTTIPKLQIQRAKKMLNKISYIKPSTLEKISSCSNLIYQYIIHVIQLHNTIVPIAKTLLDSKGEYLKSKHVTVI